MTLIRSIANMKAVHANVALDVRLAHSKAQQPKSGLITL